MKKITVFLFFLFGIIYSIYPQIVGVYLPIEYITLLERTKHNPQSWAFNIDNKSHDLLIVDFYSIIACDRIYDVNMNIYVWEITKYKFECNDNEIILIDDKNNRYKRISHDIYDVEKYWESVCNFIGKVVLDELIKSGDIILENDIIIFPALNNKRFRIQWQSFDPNNRRNLEFENITDSLEDISLEIRSNEYIFYGYHSLSRDILWSKKF